MSNLHNRYSNNFDIRLSNANYWDMYLSDDRVQPSGCSCSLFNSSLIVKFDFNNQNIFSGNTIYSLESWSGATNTGYTLNDIGLTGVDNGLVTFTRNTGDTANLALVSAMTGTTLVISSGDNRFFLHKVTGNTNNLLKKSPYNQLPEIQALKDLFNNHRTYPTHVIKGLN